MKLMGRTMRRDRREGWLTSRMEDQTARLPSDTFLWAAGVSIVGALILKVMDRRDDANFVGQWAPTLLILGLYNKLVKIAGHD